MEHMYNVPKKIDKHIERLLHKINSDFETEYIPVKPEEYSELGQCYYNVEEKVRRDGGSIHYGWALYESKILSDAERHAVWEDENESLFDITPNELGVGEILFVSENVSPIIDIDNYRENRIGSASVDDFILLAKTIADLDNLYGVRVSQIKRNLPENVRQYIIHLQTLKNAYSDYLERNSSVAAKCFCESNKAYKNCCSVKLRKDIQDNLKRIQKELSVFKK